MIRLILGMIKRTFSSRSKAVMLQLYKALVRPHLEYGIHTLYIKKLEKVQGRATRMMGEEIT